MTGWNIQTPFILSNNQSLEYAFKAHRVGSRAETNLLLQCSSDSGFLLGLSTSSCPTSISTVFSFYLQDSEAVILKLRSRVNPHSDPGEGGEALKPDQGRAGVELRPRRCKIKFHVLFNSLKEHLRGSRGSSQISK